MITFTINQIYTPMCAAIPVAAYIFFAISPLINFLVSQTIRMLAIKNNRKYANI